MGPELSRSDELRVTSEWAEALIPAGTQTFSKARNQFPQNAPRFITRAQGAHVWGDDGREYIDFTMGLGAISLGYGDPEWLEAVHEVLDRGTVFGLPHPLETEFAAELVPLLPWPDAQVRYGKNGSDATEGAIRAARALTGREAVLSIGYHGWLTTCPNQNGIPMAARELVDTGLGKDLGGYACVIVEPDLVWDLEALREGCTRSGTPLIFDEVLTGFRTPSYTWANWRGITPDAICLAKAIANGMPLSVIAGPPGFMRVFAGEVGMSFTFGGETASLAAGLATVRKYKREPVIRRMHELGRWVQGAWSGRARELGLDIPLVGQPSRMVVRYPSLAHRTLVSQEMFRRGICWTVGATLCYAHTDDDISRTAEAIDEVLGLVASVKDPVELVEGPVISHPFRTMTG